MVWRFGGTERRSPRPGPFRCRLPAGDGTSHEPIVPVATPTSVLEEGKGRN